MNRCTSWYALSITEPSSESVRLERRPRRFKGAWGCSSRISKRLDSRADNFQRLGLEHPRYHACQGQRRRVREQSDPSAGVRSTRTRLRRWLDSGRSPGGVRRSTFKRILGILAWHAQDNRVRGLQSGHLRHGAGARERRVPLYVTYVVRTLGCTSACASAVMRRGRTAVWVRSKYRVLRQSRASKD